MLEAHLLKQSQQQQPAAATVDVVVHSGCAHTVAAHMGKPALDEALRRALGIPTAQLTEL